MTTAPQRLLQPLLHDLVCCFQAPTVALSGVDGQVREDGAQGLLHADVRLLSVAEVTLDGRVPEPISGRSTGAGSARFTALARWLGDDQPDPTVRLDRTRSVAPGQLIEDLEIVSTATVAVRTVLRLRVRADLAQIELVKLGASATPAHLRVGAEGAGWGADGIDVTARFPGARIESADGGTTVVAAWSVDLAPGETWRGSWRLQARDDGGAVMAAPAAADGGRILAEADDRRLAGWLTRSLEDLDGLRMTTRERPADVFVAAGIPWYLTLFGRDSIWAARLMLPTGTDLAAGTLRTLAGLQGKRDDPWTGEAPGKIPHELRRSSSQHASSTLPPLYYGTVDATPLWVCLLHDAWRWGMRPEQVEALLPAAEAALEWMTVDGDPDGDGFLEYVDASGRGLANQGWKDSGDAVRFADGSAATGPVALCEVQGYAHEAAIGGAELLEAFGRPGADRWRTWAGELRRRFREQFWVGTGAQRRPALALDGCKRPVDSTTSNIGHLLGTGLLDPSEEARVASRVTRSDLDSGLGLRTMSTQDGGYSPLSYHCGSVWPHDTAIVVRALVRSGHRHRAAGLVEGLLAAAAAWDGRLPELWSGESWPLVPYPAACRPQAWSAAAAVAVLESELGLRVDVPAGVVRLAPAAGGSLGRLTVRGLRVGEDELTIRTDGDGGVLEVSGTSLDVEVG